MYAGLVPAVVGYVFWRTDVSFFFGLQPSPQSPGGLLRFEAVPDGWMDGGLLEGTRGRELKDVS
jgi:hypothetical protein